MAATGPKTEAGKARCAMNALKHGVRSRATIEEFRRVRYAIRLAPQQPLSRDVAEPALAARSQSIHVFVPNSPASRPDR